jgi:hypothetical protein
MSERLKDKIQLIIEETGCDSEQAQLVLNSTDNNVEKAIKIINSLLKQIVVLKGKFRAENSIYGLLILIADIKLNQVLRLANIVTYNPNIYQTSLEKPWHDFERNLYALRLGEGSLQDLTQKLQEHIKNLISSDKKDELFEALIQNNREALEKQLIGKIEMVSQDENIKLDILLEEVNLLQFKELKEKVDEDIAKLQLREVLVKPEEAMSLVLQVEMVTSADKKGIPAGDLQPGAMVWARINDQRDIAQYLAKLLGGRVKKNGVKEEIIPLAVPVEEVSIGGEGTSIKVRFGPAVIGEAIMAEDERVTVMDASSKIGRLWKDMLKIFSLQK